MKLWGLLSVAIFFATANAATIDFRRETHLGDVTEEVLSILPSDFVSKVQGKIVIEQKPLGTDALFSSEDLCRVAEDVKFGLTKNNRITISARLVELSQRNEKTFTCGHRSFRNQLKAVLIHELTHVKDNEERISKDPDFQRIVGMKKVQRSSKKRLPGINLSPSPDPYEFKNLEESLAINTEYLVLDPEFECRKPATASFLSRRLRIPLKNSCEQNHKILVQSAFLEDNYQRAASIEPKRVYQVHYLFAGKGQELMSRWGHAMFRLIVCAPFRTIAGPECLDDVSHHLVLSYRAYMNAMNLSYAKGLFGGYPSQLFILRYLEVQQEYTKYELRDLYSIPLKLTLAQKTEFLNLTLERFWTYQGHYYFLDNNCGTEAGKHLDVAIEDEQSRILRSITPLQMLKDIMNSRSGLAETGIDGLSREELIERGILVEGYFRSLNESYQFVRKYLPSFSEKNFEVFIQKTSAIQRLEDYDHLRHELKVFDPILRRQVLMKIVYLERYLAGHFLMGLPKKVFSTMNKNRELKEELLKLTESFKSMGVQPWQVVKARYGVPLSLELEAQHRLFRQKSESDREMNLEAQISDLRQILGKKYFEKEFTEIEVLSRIRKLHSDLVMEINSIHKS